MIPWNSQEQKFQVQTNRNCILIFLIFLVPMQSQWKNWYLVPMASYMHCKGTHIWFFGLNLYYHRNLKSYHTSTGSHMFSYVKGHMPSTLHDLYLHLELVWIWVEYFSTFVCIAFVIEIKWFLSQIPIYMTFYYSVVQQIFKKSLKISQPVWAFKFIFDFHPLFFGFELWFFFFNNFWYPFPVWT